MSSVLQFFVTFLWFCWLNKVFSSNMLEFIFDHLYGLVRHIRNEGHRKHAWYEVPCYLHTMKYYLLYSSANHNYCFGNKSSRFLKGQTGSVLVTYLQCILVISKMKHFFFLLLGGIFYYFILKNVFLYGWKDEEKNKILEKFPHLKSFFFDPHKNSTVCSAFNSPWE